MITVPSSSMSIWVPVSSVSAADHRPPLPITSRNLSGLIFIRIMRAGVGDRLAARGRDRNPAFSADRYPGSRACAQRCTCISFRESSEISMQVALAQAREARMTILQKMQDSIAASRGELSAYAPRMIRMKINPEKDRDVIGKGGSVIRALTEETEPRSTSGRRHRDHRQRRPGEGSRGAAAHMELTARSRSARSTTAPCFACSISARSSRSFRGATAVAYLADRQRACQPGLRFLKEGQQVKVKVIEADEKGRVRLSMKALATDPATPVTQS